MKASTDVEEIDIEQGASSGLGLKFAAGTHVGRIRTNNEDSFRASAEHGLWLVADGMGGVDGGEVASDLAASTVSDAINAGQSLEDAFQLSHIRVQEGPTKGLGKPGMGTTIVAGQFDEYGYSISWVGDSRAYIFRNGVLEQITKDHSLVQALVDSGSITEEQALVHPDRNTILQAIGQTGLDCVDVETVKGPLIKDDLIIFCSDGLTGEVTDSKISEIVKKHEDTDLIVRTLVQTALDNGGSDNVTVIALRATKESHPAPKLSQTMKIDSDSINRALRPSRRSWASGRKILLSLLSIIGICILLTSIYLLIRPSAENTEENTIHPNSK